MAVKWYREDVYFGILCQKSETKEKGIEWNF